MTIGDQQPSLLEALVEWLFGPMDDAEQSGWDVPCCQHHPDDHCHSAAVEDTR